MAKEGLFKADDGHRVTSPNTQPQLFNAERPLIYFEREENIHRLNGCVMPQFEPEVQLCV